MGLFESTYSVEQKNACTAAVVDDGISAAEVARLAAAGHLRGLPAFKPSADTVRVWVRHARAARDGLAVRSKLASLPPSERRQHVHDRLAAAVEKELDAIARAKPGTVTGKRIAECAAAWRAVEQLEGDSKHGPGTSDPGRAGAQAPPRPETLVDRLEKRARAPRREPAPLLPADTRATS